MQLTRAERWILSNQFRILEALKPDDEDWAQAREAVESGYEYAYDMFANHIFNETMSEEDGDEVISILQMFRILNGQYRKLTDKEGITERYTTFLGFDGNNETKQFAFARFYCVDMGNFDEFHALDFNSHMRLLPKYRAMLTKFNEVQSLMNYEDLSKDQIADIVSAKPGE